MNVIQYYHGLLDSTKKKAFMKALGINSRATLNKYLADPLSLSLRQGMTACNFLSTSFDIEFKLEFLGKDLHEIVATHG